MSRIEFSAVARLDRRAITAYTVERFGLDGARRLRDRFRKVLALLADSPGMGRRRSDLDPPGHSFRYFVVGKVFIIVYEPGDDGVRVVRLLHGARSLARELERDPEKTA